MYSHTHSTIDSTNHFCFCCCRYALVGAVAFASGVTHTISAAVIAVEMSGNLEMILPCLIVAVISAGITKAHGLSVYDQV